jgi:hypothetical protein
LDVKMVEILLERKAAVRAEKKTVRLAGTVVD